MSLGSSPSPSSFATLSGNFDPRTKPRQSLFDMPSSESRSNTGGLNTGGQQSGSNGTKGNGLGASSSGSYDAKDSNSKSSKNGSQGLSAETGSKNQGDQASPNSTNGSLGGGLNAGNKAFLEGEKVALFGGDDAVVLGGLTAFQLTVIGGILLAGLTHYFLAQNPEEKAAAWNACLDELKGHLNWTGEQLTAFKNASQALLAEGFTNAQAAAGQLLDVIQSINAQPTLTAPAPAKVLTTATQLTLNIPFTNYRAPAAPKQTAPTLNGVLSTLGLANGMPSFSGASTPTQASVDAAAQTIEANLALIREAIDGTRNLSRQEVLNLLAANNELLAPFGRTFKTAQQWLAAFDATAERRAQFRLQRDIARNNASIGATDSKAQFIDEWNKNAARYEKSTSANRGVVLLAGYEKIIQMRFASLAAAVKNIQKTGGNVQAVTEAVQEFAAMLRSQNAYFAKSNFNAHTKALASATGLLATLAGLRSSTTIADAKSAAPRSALAPLLPANFTPTGDMPGPTKGVLPPTAVVKVGGLVDGAAVQNYNGLPIALNPIQTTTSIDLSAPVKSASAPTVASIKTTTAPTALDAAEQAINAYAKAKQGLQNGSVAQSEVLRLDDLMTQALRHPDVLALLLQQAAGSGTVGASPGGLPPEDPKKFEPLWNALINAGLALGMEATGQVISGEVDERKLIQTTVINGLLGYLIPEGATFKQIVLGQALFGGSEEGGRQFLDYMLEGTPFAPEKIYISTAAGGTLGAAFHQVSKIIGKFRAARQASLAGAMPIEVNAPNNASSNPAKTANPNANNPKGQVLAIDSSSVTSGNGKVIAMSNPNLQIPDNLNLKEIENNLRKLFSRQDIKEVFNLSSLSDENYKKLVAYITDRVRIPSPSRIAILEKLNNGSVLNTTEVTKLAVDLNRVNPGLNLQSKIATRFVDSIGGSNYTFIISSVENANILGKRSIEKLKAIKDLISSEIPQITPENIEQILSDIKDLNMRSWSATVNDYKLLVELKATLSTRAQFLAGGRGTGLAGEPISQKFISDQLALLLPDLKFIQQLEIRAGNQFDLGKLLTDINVRPEVMHGHNKSDQPVEGILALVGKDGKISSMIKVVANDPSIGSNVANNGQVNNLTLNPLNESQPAVSGWDKFIVNPLKNANTWLSQPDHAVAKFTLQASGAVVGGTLVFGVGEWIKQAVLNKEVASDVKELAITSTLPRIFFSANPSYDNALPGRSGLSDFLQTKIGFQLNPDPSQEPVDNQGNVLASNKKDYGPLVRVEKNNLGNYFYKPTNAFFKYSIAAGNNTELDFFRSMKLDAIEFQIKEFDAVSRNDREVLNWALQGKPYEGSPWEQKFLEAIFQADQGKKPAAVEVYQDNNKTKYRTTAFFFANRTRSQAMIKDVQAYADMQEKVLFAVRAQSEEKKFSLASQFVGNIETARARITSTSDSANNANTPAGNFNLVISQSIDSARKDANDKNKYNSLTIINNTIAQQSTEFSKFTTKEEEFFGSIQAPSAVLSSDARQGNMQTSNALVEYNNRLLTIYAEAKKWRQQWDIDTTPILDLEKKARDNIATEIRNNATQKFSDQLQSEKIYSDRAIATTNVQVGRDSQTQNAIREAKANLTTSIDRTITSAAYGRLDDSPLVLSGSNISDPNNQSISIPLPGLVDTASGSFKSTDEAINQLLPIFETLQSNAILIDKVLPRQYASQLKNSSDVKQVIRAILIMHFESEANFNKTYGGPPGGSIPNQKNGNNGSGTYKPPEVSQYNDLDTRLASANIGEVYFPTNVADREKKNDSNADPVYQAVKASSWSPDSAVSSIRSATTNAPNSFLSLNQNAGSHVTLKEILESAQKNAPGVRQSNAELAGSQGIFAAASANPVDITSGVKTAALFFPLPFVNVTTVPNAGALKEQAAQQVILDAQKVKYNQDLSSSLAFQLFVLARGNKTNIALFEKMVEIRKQQLATAKNFVVSRSNGFTYKDVIFYESKLQEANQILINKRKSLDKNIVDLQQLTGKNSITIESIPSLPLNLNNLDSMVSFSMPTKQLRHAFLKANPNGYENIAISAYENINGILSYQLRPDLILRNKDDVILSPKNVPLSKEAKEAIYVALQNTPEALVIQNGLAVLKAQINSEEARNGFQLSVNLDLFSLFGTFFGLGSAVSYQEMRGYTKDRIIAIIKAGIPQLEEKLNQYYIEKSTAIANNWQQLQGTDSAAFKNNQEVLRASLASYAASSLQFAAQHGAGLLTNAEAYVNVLQSLADTVSEGSNYLLKIDATKTAVGNANYSKLINLIDSPTGAGSVQDISNNLTAPSLRPSQVETTTTPKQPPKTRIASSVLPSEAAAPASASISTPSVTVVSNLIAAQKTSQIRMLDIKTASGEVVKVVSLVDAYNFNLKNSKQASRA